MEDIDRITRDVIDVAIRIHRDLGPGLLESVYEAVLAARLGSLGYAIRRQVPIATEFEGVVCDVALRIDLLINDRVIIEVKSVDQLAKVYAKQLLTYLRLTNQPVGLLLNFGEETLKEGVRRIVNNHNPSALPAPLREPNKG